MTIDTATPAANGHAPMPADPYAAAAFAAQQSLDREAASLAEMLQAEVETGERLRRLLADSQERQRRLTKAIALLTGSDTPKPTAATPKSKSKNWTVSAKTCGKVFDALRGCEEPVTVTELAEQAGVSREAARRAIDQLREREQVRVVGMRKQQGGSAHTFTVMPDAA